MGSAAHQYIDAAFLASFCGKGAEKEIKTGKGGWKTLCPVHGDSDPSLYLNDGDGTIIFFCQVCKGSGQRQILDFFVENKIWPMHGKVGNKVWEPKKARNWKAREEIWADNWLVPQEFYNYLDEKGHILYQVVRLWDRVNEKKTFQYYRPTEWGGWKSGLAKERRIPYNLPAVLKAAQAGNDIELFEGEKDCNNVSIHGETTSCNPMGSLKWKDEYSSYFRGARVFLTPDNDFTGYEHANQVGASFKKAGIPLYIIELPGAKHKGDISDWLEDCSIEMYRELKNSAVLWEKPLQNPWPDPKKDKPSEDGKVIPIGTTNVVINVPFEAFTDSGNASRLKTKFGSEIRYAAKRGWFVWNGKRFEHDEMQRTMEMAKATARSITSDIDLAGPEMLLKWATKSLSKERLRAMLDLAQPLDDIAVSLNDFDRDDHVINFQNGVLNLKTGELMPHDQKYLCTKICPTDIDFDRVPELWLTFLETVTDGNKERIEFLQRLGGYCFTADTSLQQAYFLYGEGGNGKSVFIDTLLNILGGSTEDGYATTVRAEMFMRNPAGIEKHDDNFSQTLNKRLVAVQEVDANDRLDERKIKIFTGDSDQLTGRFMRKEAFSFRNKAKALFRCNYLPRIVNQDHGIWRRVLKIPFDVTIPKDRMIRGFADMLRPEWPGIAAWFAKGTQKLVEAQKDRKLSENPLVIPVEFDKLTDEYREESDSTGIMLEDCFEVFDGDIKKQGKDTQMSWWVSVVEFSKIYEKYAKENLTPLKKSARLVADLKTKGIYPKRFWKKRGYMGVRKKADIDF